MQTSLRAGLFALLFGVFALSACSRTYIPNSDVEDTEANRKLIIFCERYRKAVEREDIGTLLKLAAPTYYEDGGNADASDDIDFAGLREYLSSKFHDAKSIRYEIRYRRVVEDEKGIFVDYTYSASFRIPGSKGDEWRRKVEDNRLELVVHEDEYQIVAGM